MLLMEHMFPLVSHIFLFISWLQKYFQVKKIVRDKRSMLAYFQMDFFNNKWSSCEIGWFTLHLMNVPYWATYFWSNTTWRWFSASKKCALFPEYYVMPSNPREHLAAICCQRAARRVLECKIVWNILYLLSLSLPIHRSLCLLISFANSLSIVTIQ